MDTKLLLHLLCKTIADEIKGEWTIAIFTCQILHVFSAMNAEEIRRAYNLKNDFSPEEEAQVRKETAWAS